MCIYENQRILYKSRASLPHVRIIVLKYIQQMIPTFLSPAGFCRTPLFCAPSFDPDHDPDQGYRAVLLTVIC